MAASVMLDLVAEAVLNFAICLRKAVSLRVLPANFDCGNACSNS